MLSKNEKIRLSCCSTKERRLTQVVSVKELKVVKSTLSKKTIDQLERLFVEGKWLYNYIVGLGVLGTEDMDWQKMKSVPVYNPLTNDWEEREFTTLKSSQRQAIYDRIIFNIRALHSLKMKGFEVGRLKFKSEMNSIPLKQYGITHKFVSPTKIRIQGIKQKLKVRGVEQIEGLELANAVLVRNCGDYYIKITTFKDKDKILKQNNGQSIAIDFGVKNSFTLSDGRTFNYSFEETGRIKRLQQKLSRQKKGSNNRRKTKERIKKAYQKLTNKKKEAANKFVAMISHYNRVCIQDEQLDSWKVEGSRARFNSKRIQHSILGQVKSKLMSLPQTVVLEKWIPTTQWCHVCGEKTKTQGSMFECSCCGDSEDRDVHAAKNMLFILENFIPVERRDFKLVEFESSCRKTKFLTMKQEDHRSLACD